MYKNFQFIKKWFEENTERVSKLDFINTLLRKDEDCDKNRGAGNVRFIWYELAENEEETEVFKRLNIGKIPLTNSELIKAILLHNLGNDNEKINIVMEWDFIEKTLQDDRFFSFIYKDTYKNPTRIDFIFNLLANKLKREHKVDIENLRKKDERWSFYIINKILEKTKDANQIERKVKDIWKEIKEMFRIFEEFYNDNTYYHLIGFLINTKPRNIIEEIINTYKEKNKKEFEEYLKEQLIKIKLKNKTLKELSYVEDKETIYKILFLYNIILAMKSNETENTKSSLYPFIYNRYPFDLHKKEKWSLEHINPQIPTNPSEDELRELLQKWGKIVEDKKDKKIKKDIKKALRKKEKDLKEMQEVLDKIYKEYVGDVDNIENLTLLSRELNSSLQNALFVEKRRKIIEFDKKGKFVPIGTKNVFLKYYSKDPKTFDRWDKEDQEQYLEDLKKKLENYIEEG